MIAPAQTPMRASRSWMERVAHDSDSHGNVTSSDVLKMSPLKRDGFRLRRVYIFSIIHIFMNFLVLYSHIFLEDVRSVSFYLHNTCTWKEHAVEYSMYMLAIWHLIFEQSFMLSLDNEEKPVKVREGASLRAPESGCN